MDVGNGLVEIMLSTRTENTDLRDYVLETYVGEDADYTPDLWAGKPSYDTKTTNGPESFHSEYISKFYSSHPNVHEVMNVILEIRAENKPK